MTAAPTPPPDSPRSPLTYASYLALDQLLDAQHPRSQAPDELLFIVIHQVYELWFKQLLHEGTHLQARLRDDDIAAATRTIARMLTILKTIVAQVDVLETMLPAQFRAFRGALDASSGFQSAQFRELEILLGRRDERVMGAHPEGTPERDRLLAGLARPSLFDSLLVHLGDRGYAVPPAMLARDVREPYAPSAEVRAVLRDAYAASGPDAELCERLVDLDEGMMEWRYRHVQMVRRMIGELPGTGGSAGVAYLTSTLFTPAFPDLWTVRGEL